MWGEERAAQEKSGRPPSQNPPRSEVVISVAVETLKCGHFVAAGAEQE